MTIDTDSETSYGPAATNTAQDGVFRLHSTHSRRLFYRVIDCDLGGGRATDLFMIVVILGPPLF